MYLFVVVAVVVVLVNRQAMLSATEPQPPYSSTKTPRVSQFSGAALVRGPRGHAGDVWFVDASICVKGVWSIFGCGVS